ncbi:MAG: pseudouridine synthase [Rhodobacterales bacterium]|nr:pseudouridine synthase [Rhodobacterales bacterium]MDX5411966.1 pseudouridine synthase [Rhodobacterales bacterium]
MSQKPPSPAPRHAQGERIAKVIARAGVASRREAERLIETGRVTVNGEVITRAALNVTPADKVVVNGKPLDAPEPARLWLYHKPTGLVTTNRDEQGRPTIYDNLPEDMPRVMSVGRLDLNSEGLLLLTNDGAIKRQLELPSTGWLRKYRVRVNGRVTEPQLEPLRKGITADGEDFQPMIVTLDRQIGANAWLTVGLREGKNREIRRAMEAIGLVVNRLIRVSYGPFQLGQLKPGEVEEIRRRVLRDQLGISTKDDTEDSAPATKPRKPVVTRNKQRQTPSEADLFGERPGKSGGRTGSKPDRAGKPGFAAKPDRPGKSDRTGPATKTRPDAKAASDKRPGTDKRAASGKAARKAGSDAKPSADTSGNASRPARATRPAKARPKPTRT